jgi:hypothetical protein
LALGLSMVAHAAAGATVTATATETAMTTPIIPTPSLKLTRGSRLPDSCSSAVPSRF